MLKNYFKIAIRSLVKNKIYSIINISGLSVGITVSVLILIFVAHEFSYDKFHKNGNRIYRAEKRFSDGRNSIWANPEFGPAMKQIDPHVVNYVRLFNVGRKVVKSDEQHRFFEERFIFSDTSFFSIFSFPLIKGERSSLSRPSTVIITERMAAKYFGGAEAIGKAIMFNKDCFLDHVAIAVSNLDRAQKVYEDLGLSFSGAREVVESPFASSQYLPLHWPGISW